ncbi:MAG: hypothetical protein J2P25_06405 [Nocardiopsaceae bacterium]|nr:hypothetical protein [Nocardiopsaceae bacterium]
MMIDPKTDDTFRQITEHAIRNRVDDMARVIAEAGEKAYGQIAGLVVQASAYIAIDASERWPNDADLREVARIASESKASLPVTADEIHAYLSRVVFGTDRVDSVFGDAEKAALVPLYTLANLLVAFKPPQGKGWNDWLDVIESAIETADVVPGTAAPMVMNRYLKK